LGGQGAANSGRKMMGKKNSFSRKNVITPSQKNHIIAGFT
jgi:hypothetical protein